MPVTEALEFVDGVEMYRIGPLEPFLMTVVSNSDLWMFVSSTGGLTAGRVAPEQCIFPYETDDRLHHVGGRVGPATVLQVSRAGRTTRWEPFTGDQPGTRRCLRKSLLGNMVIFEEQHLELELTIRYRWAPSDRFGWVRTVSLISEDDDNSMTVDVVDGLLDVMPWGVGVAFQQQMSNLANAYRRSEITESGIGVFTLEALIVDLPEPAEAFRATTVWSTGLSAPLRSLDPNAITAARHGTSFPESSLRTGRPGSFLVNATVDLEPGETHRWHVVADVAQTHADIARLDHELESSQDLSRAIDDDIDRCSAELCAIVAGADGIQTTASPKVDAHHLANTLFNVIRGGTFANGYTVESERFRAFVAERNADVADHHADWLGGLPDSIDVTDLRTRAAQSGDQNLTRLAHEYLPLSFSRRHGDPSRPWNLFAIRVRDDDGAPLLSYQGNWRDIFQNWEALCRSFPGYLPSVVAKFVNASTADGFNPYRITSDGIDWEVPEPENPWSGIGYWGDHQIVYLYRLLSTQRAHDPAWLAGGLGGHAYSFADVPYRIAPFEQLLPRSEIHDRVRRGCGGIRGGAGRPARCRRAADSRRRWRRPPRDVAREAPHPGPRQDLELRAAGRDLDEHPASRMERRQQRPGRIRAVDGHAGPPSSLSPADRRGDERPDRRTPGFGRRRHLDRATRLDPRVARVPDRYADDRRCGPIPGGTRSRRGVRRLPERAVHGRTGGTDTVRPGHPAPAPRRRCGISTTRCGPHIGPTVCTTPTTWSRSRTSGRDRGRA